MPFVDAWCSSLRIQAYKSAFFLKSDLKVPWGGKKTWRRKLQQPFSVANKTLQTCRSLFTATVGFELHDHGTQEWADDNYCCCCCCCCCCCFSFVFPVPTPLLPVSKLFQFLWFITVSFFLLSSCFVLSLLSLCLRYIAWSSSQQWKTFFTCIRMSN